MSTARSLASPAFAAAEKVRVVHALDRLGVDMIEAGFPSSNPKELELFERRSRRVPAADGGGDLHPRRFPTPSC